MRISLSITHYPDDPAAGLDRIVRTADDGGLDTVWVVDHLLQVAPGSDPEAPMLEAYTTLGFLAARSSRVRLGTMVTGVTFRPPALLVKAVTTLDVLSGGRAWLGVGTGHSADEAAATGLPFPPTSERYARLEETVLLARRMWDGGASPAPATRPGPPLLVGGHGERRTLPLVARYADACNLFDIPDGGATIRRKLAVLAGLCTGLGRDPAEIETTVSTWLRPDETAAAFADRCRALHGYGIDHVVVITPEPWTAERLACLTTTVAAVARSG